MVLFFSFVLSVAPLCPEIFLPTPLLPSLNPSLFEALQNALCSIFLFFVFSLSLMKLINIL